MKFLSLVVLTLGATLALGACGSDDDETKTDTHKTPAECDSIIDACHEADHGSDGAAHECHENAHDVWTGAECTAQAATCIAACEALEADSGAAGASGAGGQGGGDDHDH